MATNGDSMVIEAGAGSEDIPFSARMFNDDSYLRTRKTWDMI
jgi:hypothetical protein